MSWSNLVRKRESGFTCESICGKACSHWPTFSEGNKSSNGPPKASAQARVSPQGHFIALKGFCLPEGLDCTPLPPHVSSLEGYEHSRLPLGPHSRSPLPSRKSPGRLPTSSHSTSAAPTASAATCQASTMC